MRRDQNRSWADDPRLAAQERMVRNHTEGIGSEDPLGVAKGVFHALVALYMLIIVLALIALWVVKK